MMLHSSSSQLRCYAVHHHGSSYFCWSSCTLSSLLFHCHLSVLTLNVFFIEYRLCVICLKYLNLLIVAKVSTECLGIIWLVTDTFILLTVHGIINLSFTCFPLHQYRPAGKTVGYSWCWLKLPTLLWLLSIVPLLVCLSLYFSCSLHWYSCHWWR